MSDKDKFIAAELTERLEDMIPRLQGFREEIDSLIVEIKMLTAGHGPKSSRYVVGVIERVVTEHFGVKMAELRSKKMNRELTHPRQVFSVLVKKFTKLSYADAGAYVNRDHATVMHSQRVINNARDTGDPLWWEYQECQSKVQSIIDELIIKEAQK